MKHRKHIIIESGDLEILEEIQQSEGLRSLGDAVSFLVSNYRQSQPDITSALYISEMVSRNLKDQYDVIRIRTGYAEKYLRILLDMFNHYIIETGQDLVLGEEAKLIDKEASLIYRKSEQAYGNKINRYKENKNQ